RHSSRKQAYLESLVENLARSRLNTIESAGELKLHLSHLFDVALVFGTPISIELYGKTLLLRHVGDIGLKLPTFLPNSYQGLDFVLAPGVPAQHAIAIVVTLRCSTSRRWVGRIWLIPSATLPGSDRSRRDRWLY